jgi:hypothetical protein
MPRRRGRNSTHDAHAGQSVGVSHVARRHCRPERVFGCRLALVWATPSLQFFRLPPPGNRIPPLLMRAPQHCLPRSPTMAERARICPSQRLAGGLGATHGFRDEFSTAQATAPPRCYHGGPTACAGEPNYWTAVRLCDPYIPTDCSRAFSNRHAVARPDPGNR